MKRIFLSRWTYRTIGIMGFALLAGYLWFSEDWRISIPWTFAVPCIFSATAATFAALNLFDRFPRLNAYLLYPATDQSIAQALTNDEWALRQANYLESGMRGWIILTAAAEDGLICVPLLLVGITPVSALLAGGVFGFLHLGRFTFLECIAKAIAYALVCYFVLPNGLNNVVVGHLALDIMGLGLIKIIKYKLPGRLP